MYRGMAIRFNALISGGSDFHGEDPAATAAGTPGAASIDLWRDRRCRRTIFAALEERPLAAPPRQGSARQAR